MTPLQFSTSLCVRKRFNLQFVVSVVAYGAEMGWVLANNMKMIFKHILFLSVLYLNSLFFELLSSKIWSSFLYGSLFYAESTVFR